LPGGLERFKLTQIPENEPIPVEPAENLGLTHNDPGYDASDIRVLEGI
jgi:hypothetical protein